MKLKVLQPLSGVLFLALMASAFITGGKPPTANEMSASAYVHAWQVNAHHFKIAILLMALAMVVFVAFASHLKDALDAAEGETGTYSRLVFAGVLIFVMGWATDITLAMAMIKASASKHIDPVAIQAMGAYWDNDWVPFAIGVGLLQLGAGLSILCHGGLPKWLGVVSLLIVVLSVTPWGFGAMPATALWILIVAITMAIKAAKA